MPYKIAIASGKGGTGKTTVAVNLYSGLKQKFGSRILLADCDVEEPNTLLFFHHALVSAENAITQMIPAIDTEKCTFCRECVMYCEFNAIVVLPTAGFAAVNPELCHSCGACSVACTESAVTEYSEVIGSVNLFNSPDGDQLVEGRLKIGSARQTPMVKAVKKKVKDKADIIIYDAPPGTSCQVVETISGANYIVLVTEPTPFGLHDLQLMVSLVRELKIPFGIVINKSGIGNREVYDFIEHEGIQLIGEVPFSKEYASMYAKGKITGEVPDIIHKAYSGISEYIAQNIYQHDGNYCFEW